METNFASSPADSGSLSNRHVTGLTSVLLGVAWVLVVPLVLTLALIFGGIPGIGWIWAIPLGLATTLAFTMIGVRNGVDRLLELWGATSVDEHSQPRFHNLVEGLTLASGVEEPELYVVEDNARNAAALASTGRSAIVATTGLLEALDRIELEAVLALAVARIRSGHAEAATTGAALFRRVRWLSAVPPLARWGESAAGRGLGRLLGEQRDLESDQAAVGLTRYPPGLAQGLTTLSQGPMRPTVASRDSDHLWLVSPPASEGPDSRSEQPLIPAASLALRIDVLNQL